MSNKVPLTKKIKEDLFKDLKKREAKRQAIVKKLSDAAKKRKGKK